MKILALADVDSKYLWDYFEEGKLEEFDLIISCGDLKAEYLSFLATFTMAPVLYVHGNHDREYADRPPEGCICIDGDIYTFQGVRILGLGGSMRYIDGPCQYTEKEMKRRVCRLWPKLLKHKGFDILVAHAPAYGLGDGQDLPHIGFQVFHSLLRKYEPKYFIHGHMHLTYHWRLRQARESLYQERTIVVNAYERYEIEYKAGQDI